MFPCNWATGFKLAGSCTSQMHRYSAACHVLYEETLETVHAGTPQGTTIEALRRKAPVLQASATGDLTRTAASDARQERPSALLRSAGGHLLHERARSFSVHQLACRSTTSGQKLSVDEISAAAAYRCSQGSASIVVSALTASTFCACCTPLNSWKLASTFGYQRM
jgi:hypothetical protein